MNKSVSFVQTDAKKSVVLTATNAASENFKTVFNSTASSQEKLEKGEKK